MLTLLVLSLFRRVTVVNAVIPLTLFVLCFAIPHSAAQTLHYEIWSDNKLIGRLEANCKSAGAETVFSIESEVKTHFIVPINVLAHMEDIFNSGKLCNSTYVQQVNGFSRLNKKTYLTTGLYVLTDKKSERKSEIIKIPYTMACMYFIEPVNMPFVYSENFQQFVSIFSLGNARYQVTFPDKSCSYYQYKDGLLVQLEVNNEWANLTFKLIEEKFEAVR